MVLEDVDSQPDAVRSVTPISEIRRHKGMLLRANSTQRVSRLGVVGAAAAESVDATTRRAAPGCRRSDPEYGVRLSHTTSPASRQKPRRRSWHSPFCSWRDGRGQGRQIHLVSMRLDADEDFWNDE